MWVVKITKPIPLIRNNFRDGFFPREVRYKADAVKLKKEIESTGGQATIEKRTR